MVGSAKGILELITVQLWLVSEILVSGVVQRERNYRWDLKQDLKQGNKDGAEHILFWLALF